MINIYPNLNEYILNKKDSKFVNRKMFFMRPILNYKYLKAINTFKNSKYIIINNSKIISGKYECELLCLNRLLYFCSYISIDYNVLMYTINNTKNSFIRKNHIRYLAVILYEAMTEIENIKGREYSTILEKYADIKIKNKILDNLRVLRKYREKHLSEIKAIRNNIGAHRILDIEQFEKYINEIDDRAFMTFTSVYMTYIVTFSVYNTMLFEKISKENLLTNASTL